MPEDERDSERFQEALQLAQHYRELHAHENNLTNHRFQWFALMTGLLAATYGLLWEFKSTAEVPMLTISAFGFLVSLSATLSAIFTARAHAQIGDSYKMVFKARNHPVSAPIRGCVYRPQWRFFLPWNFIYPLFTLFWIGMGICVVTCSCPE
ncbi:MAG: hypothetical protein AAGI48_16005 [Verrucomicrobiota bacterium]